MAKKYKINIADEGYKGLREIVNRITESGITIEPFDINNYTNNEQRVAVFNGAGEVLSQIFNHERQVVDVNKEDDTIGGEITVSVVDAVLSGDELVSFIRTVSSANEVEFTSFVDGHTELGLIYTDLMSKKGNCYEN